MSLFGLKYMGPHVFPQSGSLGKTFATVLAPIRFFARVSSLVCSKIPGLRKRLETETAMKWLFARVGSHVNLKKKGRFKKTK